MHERRYRQVHLDFHTSADCEGVGADFDPEVFARTVRLGHVDSMTVFAKCHHGFSYYPTEVGTAEEGALDRTRISHRSIYDAISNRDAELARSAATMHIAEVEAWFRRLPEIREFSPPNGSDGSSHPDR